MKTKLGKLMEYIRKKKHNLIPQSRNNIEKRESTVQKDKLIPWRTDII